MYKRLRANGNFCSLPFAVSVILNLSNINSIVIIQLAGLKNYLDVPVNRPVLMFWPTDDAIKGLPRDLMARLTNPSHVGDLIRFIEYHVVTQIQVS